MGDLPGADARRDRGFSDARQPIPEPGRPALRALARDEESRRILRRTISAGDPVGVYAGSDTGELVGETERARHDLRFDASDVRVLALLKSKGIEWLRAHICPYRTPGQGHWHNYGQRLQGVGGGCGSRLAILYRRC